MSATASLKRNARATRPAATVTAPATINRNLTEDDIRILAEVTPSLRGAWRYDIRRGTDGDIEAVIARTGVWLGANAFVVRRNGSTVSLIATSWPFDPETLGTYDSMDSLADFLGNAIGRTGNRHSA